MKKFVLVEGIPGSGKSTTARFLANQFERNGYRSSLFLETTYPHPIIHDSSFHDVPSFAEAYLERWNDFLLHTPETDVIVMESALLQSPIVHLLHQDVDRDLIQSVIIRACRRLSEEDSTLIYLYQIDTHAAIQRMIDIRGREAYLLRKHEEYKHQPYFVHRMEQGPQSHISFFLDYAALANQIVQAAPISKITIENAAREYTLYEQQLLHGFQLQHVPDPQLDMTVLSRYTGSYHSPELNVGLTIELREGHLYIFGNRKLKPKSETQFYLDDMSVTANFVHEDDSIPKLVITEKDRYANKREEGAIFEKVPQT